MSDSQNDLLEDGDGTEELQPQKVELEPETYNALLDRIAELEAASTATPAASRRQKEDPTLEDLIEEGTTPRRQERSVAQPPKDLDELTNSQLAHYVVDVINQQAAERLNKVEVAVETLRVLRQIDKAENKHEDFWRYEDKIKEISIANPTLDIEDVYHLAKSKVGPIEPKEGDKSNPKEPTRTEKLLKLPARAFGEKPTVAASTTRDINRNVSLRSAAEHAWDDVVGKGKTTV